MTAPIVAYKGFSSDWTCRGFQFEVGKTYTHVGDVEVCEVGFHACERPIDVLQYYAPSTSRFATVEQSGELRRHYCDTKVASRTISIKAEISLADLIKATIDWTWKKCAPPDPASQASATGDRGAASATGDRGAASATGDSGAASATGYRGAASATGDSGAASATGDRGAAMACGRFGRAMGADGCALFLVYRDCNLNIIIHAKAAIVGQNGIKAFVWYSLDEEGNFVEAAA